MLTEILRLLEQNGGELDCLQLSRQLDVQPSAVAGMIETLLRKGRLVELSPTCGPCDDCIAKTDCRLPALRARRYAALTRSDPVAPE